MLRRAIPMLAALIAATALADQEPMQPQGSPPMMVPAMQSGYNPYLMMPNGMPMQQMPTMPYGMPMPQQMPAMPYGMPMPAMPYGMPMPQQMPAMPYGMPMQQQMPQQAMPAPQPAPAADPISALSSSLAQSAGPALSALMAQVPNAVAANPYMNNVAPFNPLNILVEMSQHAQPKRPYEMRRVIDPSEKTQMMQMMLPMMTTFMRMGMPDMMNYMARKYKAKPGLSFDDVRDSLFLRANQLNMKKVGENLMWKDFQAVLNDKDAPRIEVYSFCDIDVGRELLRTSPEFIVFLPCRIAVMEDADKNVWVLMVDWNMDWVAGYEKQLNITDGLSKGAKSINDRMVEMMKAAANGDL